ncbi:hypothetical protein [Jiella mangrovi]|uniref:CBS domain-containing protein n=1 Tax=Jiella mangrovi TaxID=2821407 RepID=A0ABS4BM42_9HYPH|nr:hypothetical protein [Jiella mangrovi]MBP0617802.1 hypothetical protein [Jiella mangrovi]
MVNDDDTNEPRTGGAEAADAMALYRRFLNGDPGTCVVTVKEGCHAFSTGDEINATYSSRHDTDHFVWLTPDRDPVGFISDERIDDLLNRRAIALFASDMGPITVSDPDTAAAVARLKAERRQAVLDLPTDSDQRVGLDAVRTLPPALSIELEPMVKDGPVSRLSLADAVLPKRWG